jgi:hypothetical protein
MSTEPLQEGLVHPDEVDDARAGEVGIPVHARCVSCRDIRFKRIGGEDTVEETETFKHVCHECQRATYWNVLYILDENPTEGSA